MLILRGTDKHGSGAWQAPRGNHKHRGIDLACCKGSEVYSQVSGVVSKIGYPYSSDSKRHLRYVEVTEKIASREFRHRVMYISPSVAVGDAVVQDETIIGVAQGLTDVYPGIHDHVHYEVIDFDGEYINPMSWLTS